MNKFLIYLLLLTGLVFTSCVPTRNLTYLQNKSGNAQPQPISAIALKPYRLQTNDIISISIKAIDPKLVEMFNVTPSTGGNQTNETLYFTGYTIDDHGNVRIPILGEVNVLGFTLEEARSKIEQQLLAEYFREEAAVYVNVKLAGFRYTINGEVTSPGSQILMQEKVNIMEAIANAGDITVTGDRRSVSVIRQFPHGTEIHNIDLTDAAAMQSPYYYLQPNDYIYVKPLPQKAWGTGTTGLQSFTTIISVLTLVTTTFLLLTQ
ncbi:MAG TPA: polysaccharide biosynthesis/export family protein [Flavobacterium sp.]|jgi:polysaccharide export outer membrane protein